jgi:hypothetical protein
MHMQDGIGRGGYRVLSLVFFGVGALGLLIAAVALRPSGLFEWLGLALAAIAIATLTGLILATLGPMAFASASGAPRRGIAGAPDEGDGVVPLPTPEPPADIDPNADLGFEYPSDGSMPSPVASPSASSQSAGGLALQEQPALGGLYRHQDPPPLPPVSAPAPRSARASGPPAPMARPAQRSAPPSGKADPAGSWPERKGKAGMTRREAAERAQPVRESGTQIEFDRPAGAPAPRREAPIVMARTVASAEATGIPEGTGVGKCGNCGVLLLAPKKRPIRLQCPRCERVHTLA